MEAKDSVEVNNYRSTASGVIACHHDAGHVASHPVMSHVIKLQGQDSVESTTKSYTYAPMSIIFTYYGSKKKNLIIEC